MTARPRLFPAIVAALLLPAGCGHDGVRLAASERNSLDEQPAIHVLHYATPLPVLKASNKTPPPRPETIRRAVGADPAALVAAGFSRLIGRRQKLRNLKLESQSLPRPVAGSALGHKPKYRRGLALELWLDTWAFEAVAGAPGQYGMRLAARARLSRLDDGQVLWSTGQCRVDGARGRDYRLAVADLDNAVKLRKLLAAARDECARQLARDFYAAETKP